MIRMLICDDEPVISDGMREIFSRDERLDVYNVYSSAEAFEILNKIRIDIVLLDIQMPGVNGLEALARIKRVWTLCQVIMLTGHDDFQYIYEATSYPGVKYILKNEGYRRITEAVDEAIENINRQIHETGILEKAKKQLKSMNDILKKDFLLNTLKGLYEKPSAKDCEIVQELDLETPAALMLCRSFGDDVNDSVPRNQYLYQLGHIVGMYITSFCSYEIVISDAENIFFFIQLLDSGQNASAVLKGNLEIAQEYCKSAMGANISFVIDLEPASWGVLWEKSDQLLTLMDIMADSGRGMFICEAGQQRHFTELRSEQLDLTVESVSIPPSKMEKLIYALNNNKETDFFVILNEIKGSVIHIKSLHSLAAQERYHAVALPLMTCINKHKLSIRLAFETSLYKLVRADSHESWADAFAYLEDLSGKIFKLRAADSKENENEIVLCIKEHVRQNLKDPNKLSLMYISDMLYFNPSYLSRLFKQLTGNNLSEFIIISRMELAKSLLLSSSVRISDVAEEVGYASPANFTRIFKKVVGQSPHDYRVGHAINQTL